MIQLQVMMHELLDNACPASDPASDPDGWGLYWIELHCVGYWVRARKVNGTWEIDSYTAEDC